MNYKISKNVPPPNTVKKYPFEIMKVGDSFWIPREYFSKNTQNNVHKCAKERGFKVSTRTYTDGMTVWRIK